MSAMSDTYGPLPSYITPDPSVQPISMPSYDFGSSTPNPNDFFYTGPSGTSGMDQMDPGTLAMLGLDPGQVNIGNGGTNPGFVTPNTSGGGNILSQILHSLGFTNGSGNANWMSILGALAPFLAGGLTSHATNQATQQTMAAINNAEGKVTDVYNQNRGAFTPFVNAGPGAISGLQGMVGSNLASQFSPLGTGRGITLGQLAGK